MPWTAGLGTVATTRMLSIRTCASAEPWRPGLPVHVMLNSPAALGTVFHAATVATSPKAHTFVTELRPGSSAAEAVGFQLNMRGAW